MHIKKHFVYHFFSQVGPIVVVVVIVGYDAAVVVAVAVICSHFQCYVFAVTLHLFVIYRM